MFEAFVASFGVALCSLVGVLVFSGRERVVKIERLMIPLAVGVFLALALNELIPEVVVASPVWGGTVIGIGFIAFYVIAYLIHQRLHHVSEQFCEKREAAILLLIGDAIHNFADGIVIGGAFLLSPEIGVATAFAVALHEIPQEIAEYGVYLRAGYTAKEAMVRNFISATTVIFGTILTMLFAQTFGDFVWVLGALAAGNLLYIAATELLPRLHDSLLQEGGFFKAVIAVCLGFTIMSSVMYIAHEHINPDPAPHTFAPVPKN